MKGFIFQVMGFLMWMGGEFQAFDREAWKEGELIQNTINN